MTPSSYLKFSFLAASVMVAFSPVSFANEKSSDIELVTIFSTANPLNDIPGSAHMINSEELEKFEFTDIMRTLTSIPGVYVLEEDGYGLRPNIGMRGTGQNRSEKVTIMEDNVLAAPAPYAAPSAYYFPTAGRMTQVEVLKGTSSAMYGPRTTGGVVNMLSRQIPEEKFAGAIKGNLGEDGYGKVHAYVGGKGDNISSVFEVFRYQADGFKDINHSDNDTGFVKNDVMAKVRINSGDLANYYQELEFKFKYSDEDSDETYVGLTQDDYESDPYSRYSASQLDNMDTEHKQIQINHLIVLSDAFSVTTNAYYNDFHRNWYKTNKIDGLSLSSGGVEAAAMFDQDSSSGAINVDVKANNRDYISQGVQSVLNADFAEHQVKIGARYHEDEMDRFQWVDAYTLNSNYEMTLVNAGVPGTDSNRIDSADAIALFIHDEYTIGSFIINAGVRYEDITLERDDWGKNDSGRDSKASHKENSLDVVLPSLAVTYKLSEQLVLLGGVQKGFAPPAPGNEDAEEEESINYEFGARYNQNDLQAEAILFFSDYENMHGNCTASQGCDDDNIGNQYNAGEVDVKGLEVKLGNSFQFDSFSIPVDVAYTFTETEFQNDFASDLDTWGNVKSGDELPYVPENQLQVTVGFETDTFRTDLLIRYMDEMRTVAGQGNITEDDLIDSRVVVDLAAHYNLTDNQKLSFNVDNLLDEEYVSTKTHGSIMVGKPRTFMVGYAYQF